MSVEITQLGSIFESQSKFQEAEKYYKMSLDMKSIAYGNTNPCLSDDFANLGIINIKKGFLEIGENKLMYAYSLK